MPKETKEPASSAVVLDALLRRFWRWLCTKRPMPKIRKKRGKT